MLSCGSSRTSWAENFDEAVIAQFIGEWLAQRVNKQTKSTFARILESDYVAQAYVPPSERLLLVDGEREMLKADARWYTCQGSLVHAAARLYRGQATNLRTPGDGFAPLLLQDN